MSSREIADLVEKRHDKVKQSIERLERGVIIQPPMGDEQDVATTPTGGHRNYTTRVYHLGQRDTYIVVAQLLPEFTARVVDRWQELEVERKPDPVAMLTDPAALRSMLIGYTEKVQSLEGQVQDMAPMVTAHAPTQRHLVCHDGSIGTERRAHR